jgi:taurine dioxygenase
VIGAEIRGVDLHQPLDSATVAALRTLLLRYKVVFFPGQHLQPAEHTAFAAHFGELTPAHPVVPGIEGQPEVFEIDYTKSAQLRAQYGNVASSRGLDWHTDVTFVERPPFGSILNAVVIPSHGGDTLWSNQAAAYEGLSPALQRFLEGLTALHDGRAQFQGALDRLEDGGSWDGEAYRKLVPVEHPVVITHPETGERALFVNPGFTSRIVQLNRRESDHLLSYLYEHSVQPEYVVRYHWTAGDVGFWDNRVTQHAVVGDFGTQHRVIQRVTLRGQRPSA